MEELEGKRVGFVPGSSVEQSAGGLPQSSETKGEANKERNFKLKKDFLHNIKEDLATIDPSGRNIRNLAEGTLYLINETLDQKPDTIFFLDKSARPAAHLFRETWRRLLPDKKLPNIRFINVGRGQEGDTGEFALDQVRKKFTGIEEDNILVADEYSQTGETLKKGIDTIGKIFPKAKSVSGTAMYGSLPPWYGDESSIGVMENENDFLTGGSEYLVKPYRRHPDAVRSLRQTLSRFAADIAANVQDRV